MFNKPFNDIQLSDVENLVKIRKERENNHLEYKTELGNSDTQKLKFIKSVTGFANASGGFIIIGVKENDDGIPGEICGIENKIGNQKIDEWINNVLISNIDEKVRFEGKLFNIENNRVVVVLYIPESPKKPHMVTLSEKNTYYIRHNTSVNPATQIEVKDMFEYSRKNIDVFEDFLRKRNLFDKDNEHFGVNTYSKRLFNNLETERGVKKPVILYSFIPRYLDEERVNTASYEILDWLLKHSRGIEPFSNVDLFSMSNREINLYGIVLPKLRNIENLPENELYADYSEFLNNGFFESGLSRDLTKPYTCSNVFELTFSIGYAWVMFNFAQQYFTKIDYFDEVLFQLSVINIKDFTLCGFINDNHRWAEPCSSFYYQFPVCSHDRFMIREKFIVSELSSELIQQFIVDLAEKVSRAFGEYKVKCFDDEGNFNYDGMYRFRY